MSKFFKVLYFSSILLSQTALAGAATGPYTPLVALPGVPSTIDTSNTDLSSYLGVLYKFGIAAAAALAVIMVIWGGVEYITSVAGEGKSGGKERITSAILGLLLALGSYIILNTINPDLLKLTFTLPDAKVSVSVPKVNSMNYVVGNTNILNSGGTYLDANGKAIWGNPNASSMQGQTIDNTRFTYYGPGETGSSKDGNTAAWNTAITEGGMVLFNPNNSSVVSSSGSVYYPAGTIWSHTQNGQTFYHVVDDNNIGSNGLPRNTNVTNNHTFDLPITGEPEKNANSNPGLYPQSNTKSQILYVPSTRPPNSQIQSLHNINTLQSFLQSQSH